MAAGLMRGVGWADLIAPLFFVACWVGYARWAGGRHGTSLMGRVHEYRLVWMQRMLERDVRIVDVQVTQVLVNSISFLASSAVLIVGGLVAVLGARDRALEVLADLPLTTEAPPFLWELKVLVLVIVFVYAFFKFTWALRQFNYVAILIGAAPLPERAHQAESARHAERTARIASAAAENFNKAMRSYYFGMAALSWFVQPYLFMLLTAWVVVILWRREFRSASLAVLGPAGHP